ncbi:nucleotidyltransferase family protein [Pseudoxanthomonas beigongshangi]
MTFAHDAVVLAAGGSRRLGQAKQLLTRDDETLVHRCVRLAAATGPQRLLLITGSHADAVAAAVADLPVDIHRNADWEEGLASSLRLAAGVLVDAARPCLLLICDQPALEAVHLQRLREGFVARGCAATRHGDACGVPALVPADVLARAPGLTGDHGLRGLLAARGPERVALLDAPELGRDLDTPADLREARARGWIDPAVTPGA